MKIRVTLTEKDLEYLVTGMWDSMISHRVYEVDSHEFKLLSKLLKALEDA